MVFLGTIINFSVVLIFGLIGALVKKSIPDRISSGIIYAMGICIVYVGIDGALAAPPSLPEGAYISPGLLKVLIMIFSMGIGTLIGELIDVDKQMNRLGLFVEKKLSRSGECDGSFAKGFASCSILFCVGAMAVNGAIQDAFGNPDVLIIKSLVDGIMVLVMSSTLGIGCAFSAFTVLIYQGGITALAFLVSDLLSEAAVSYMSATGSLVIILIGTNMLKMTNVKTANMVFAMFVPLALYPLVSFIL